MNEKLASLRRKIDEIDRDLVTLLAQRMGTVAKIVRLKSTHGVSNRAPEREQEILAARRTQAEELGASTDLIEDLFLRILRESYEPESNATDKRG